MDIYETAFGLVACGSDFIALPTEDSRVLIIDGGAGEELGFLRADDDELGIVSDEDDAWTEGEGPLRGLVRLGSEEGIVTLSDGVAFIPFKP